MSYLRAGPRCPAWTRQWRRFSHVGRELVSLSVASHLKRRYGCHPVALGFDHQVVGGARQVFVKDGETVAVCSQLQICRLCSLEGSPVCAHAGAGS
jgi:hypothetical protein